MSYKIFEEIIKKLMRKILFLLLFFNMKTFGQSVNCNFVVNSEFVDQTNQQVFLTLERGQLMSL